MLNALIIEIDDEVRLFSFKVGGWIIKSEMAIFTDAYKRYIDGMFGDQFSQPFAFGLRVGFAVNFFSAGGIRTRESAGDETSEIACLCGTDERYAAEAVDRVRALKAAGCKRVLLAGRPGALEEPLRRAGIDGFIFVGCDVVTTLSDLLDTPS